MAWSVMLSLILSGNVEETQLGRLLERNPIPRSYALLAVGGVVLVAGAVAVVAYGGYALWGKTKATTDAFGIGLRSKPDMPPPPEPPKVELPAPVVEEPAPAPAPPPPEPYEIETSPPLPATPEASPDATPPPAEEPVEGSAPLH